MSQNSQIDRHPIYGHQEAQANPQTNMIEQQFHQTPQLQLVSGSSFEASNRPSLQYSMLTPTDQRCATQHC